MKKLNEIIKNNSKTKKILLIVLALFVLAIISFCVYEIATVNNTYYINEKNLQIPIFVYHNIVKDNSEVAYDYMQTTVETFEKQITGLMKLGYKPISYQDLVEYNNGKKAIPKWSFLITFDDGYTGIYDYAEDIAKKYNIPMSMYVINDCVGKEGYCTWEQLKQLHDNGNINIYLHGYTHIEYDKESKEKLLEDTKKAYNELQENLGDTEVLKVFTYPYGLHTTEQRELLYKNGFIQNLTDNKINCSNKLDLSGLHRCYPLEDSVAKILLKIQYRMIRYGG